jgi:osmoprotectant transport system ATP-binding protein
MIKLAHVSKSFGPGKKAVNDISFEVQEGETLVLLGTSGCGKTTTLRMINRLLEPGSGHIYVNGTEVRQLPPKYSAAVLVTYCKTPACFLIIQSVKILG